MTKKEKPKSKKRTKKTIRIIIWTVLILIIAVMAFIFLPKLLNSDSEDAAALQKTTAAVQRGDVARSLGVSSSVIPSESEDYSAGVSGEILNIAVTDGDYVEAGQVILVLDTEATDDTIQVLEDQIVNKQEQIGNLYDAIEDAYSSIDDRNDTISDKKDDIADLYDEIVDLEADVVENEALKVNLNLYAPITGTVFNLQVNEGDNVNPGTRLATITDTISYEVEMAFSSSFLDRELQDVTVYYKNNKLTAEIISYADYTYKDQFGNGLVDVIIAFKTDISLPDHSQVTATITASEIPHHNKTEGYVYFADSENIFPEVSGEVLELYLIEKQSVEAGDLIAVLDGETIDNTTTAINSQIESKYDQIDSLNDSNESSLDNINQFHENIDDYTDDIAALEDDITDIEVNIEEASEGYISAEITAEFSGIVTGIMFDEGDDVGANQKLFTLVSLDYPEMNLTIDELDINEVTEGLEAEVVIDALPETEKDPVTAVVTDISLTGNTQGGVTTYTVTIALTESVEGLKFGMNGTATVFTSQSKDTLYIPIEAVTVAGDKSYVFVTDRAAGASGTYDKSDLADKSAVADNAEGNIAGRGGAARPGIAGKDPSTMTDEQKAKYEEFLKTTENFDAGSDNSTFSSIEDYYIGATRVEITTGIHNETQIEILSGLTEGQIVVLPPVYISNTTAEINSTGGLGDLGAARKAMGGISGGGK